MHNQYGEAEYNWNTGSDGNSKADWESMDEQEFDTMLQNTLDEIPPVEVINSVTPWRRAMNQILTGMVLNTFTLNFGLLNYILPTIGVILMLLGFRTLRRENKWFQACWRVTLFRAVYVFVLLILNTTIIQSEVYASSIGNVLTFLGVLVIFVQFFCLWQSLKMLQKKTDVPVNTNSAAALLCWYGVICLLDVVQLEGLVVILIMLAAYIFIIRSLYKLSKVLDEAGYVIEAAPVQLTDRMFTTVILTMLGVGMLCGYLFGGSYAMDWTLEERETTSKTEEIEAHLMSLGFPENILKDLTEEDLKACEGALRVAVDLDEYPVNNGRVEKIERKDEVVIDRVYDVKELQITGIAVELPGKREQWKIFHHFEWKINPGFRGTESVMIWPAYRQSKGWSRAGGFTGRLLYDRDGQVYTAPYHTLGEETYVSESFFWDGQSSTDVFATFSLPKRGEKHRGYVSYTIKEMEDGWTIDTWMNYTHQKSRVQYPVKTAVEHEKMGGWNRGEAFILLQDSLSFHPTEEEIEVFK